MVLWFESTQSKETGPTRSVVRMVKLKFPEFLTSYSDPVARAYCGLTNVTSNLPGINSQTGSGPGDAGGKQKSFGFIPGPVGCRRSIKPFSVQF